MLREAEAHLQHASGLDQLGPFQLEAAIQSAHVAHLVSGVDTAQEIAALYDGLVALAPTLSTRVGRAAATLAAGRPKDGIAQLSALPEDEIASYQPFWAVLAHLLDACGAPRAADAYERAIGLSEDPGVRDYLLERFTRLESKNSERE